jgi:hypothetical protein
MTCVPIRYTCTAEEITLLLFKLVVTHRVLARSFLSTCNFAVFYFIPRAACKEYGLFISTLLQYAVERLSQDHPRTEKNHRWECRLSPLKRR